MAVSGRRPKPPALKKLMGNPGKRPIPEVAPLPETGEPRMPKYLERDSRAAALWEYYAPALIALGTLRKESESLFARWCVEEAAYRRNPRKFNASRLAQIRIMEGSLGMDPSVRGRLKLPVNGDDKKDPADEFFAGPKLAAG